MTQMALPLRLADHAVFDSYLSTGNETLVAMLADLASGTNAQGCWIWGAPATGKTHLLQAACDKAGDRSVYVPLRMLKAVSCDRLAAHPASNVPTSEKKQFGRLSRSPGRQRNCCTLISATLLCIAARRARAC